MRTYVCPNCETEWRCRESSIGTVQRCRNCRVKVRLWEVDGPKPPMNHAPHIVGLIVTCGLWLPVYVLAIIAHEFSGPTKVIKSRVV